MLRLLSSKAFYLLYGNISKIVLSWCQCKPVPALEFLEFRLLIGVLCLINPYAAGGYTKSLPIQNHAKKLKKKWLKPWHMGTQLTVLSVSFPMNTNMTGLDGFQNSWFHCALDESSLSSGRVKLRGCDKPVLNSGGQQTIPSENHCLMACLWQRSHHSIVKNIVKILYHLKGNMSILYRTVKNMKVPIPNCLG